MMTAIKGNNNVKCQLLKKEIDDGTCFDVQMCAEGLWAKDDNPHGVRDIADFEQICLSCENHEKETS